MESVLLLYVVVIVICIVASRLSQRLGAPALLLFLALGMLSGSDELFRVPFDSFEATERIYSVALVFIMFYGGFDTRWEAARPVAARVVVLSTLGVVIIVLLTALFYHFAPGFSVLESFLTGIVISSTDAASVLPILHSKKLGLRDRTASLLEVESGNNDPASYMLTAIILSLMGVGGGGATPWMVSAQVVFGLGLGAAVAGLSILVLHRLTLSDGLGTIFVVAAALLSFTLPAVVGGNGHLEAYLAGILIGDAKVPHKAALVHFFDGLTGLAQILIFFLLELFSFPRQLPAVLFPVLAIMVFLTLVVWLVAVFLLLAPFRCGVRQCLLVSWAGLRGATSIVFAIMAVTSEAAIGYDLFCVVFCTTLLLVVMQGSLLPLAARKPDMVDSTGSVSHTFNDYQDRRQLHLTRFPIGVGHPWVGRTTGECELPVGALVAILRRGSENVIPNGDTAIQAGDLMVLSTPLYEDDDGVSLREVPVAEHRDWIGGSIKELGIPAEVFIILVRRADDTTVAPKDGTILQQGDMLVVNEWEKT